MDVLLSDDQYRSFVKKYVALLVQYGFISENEAKEEVEDILDKLSRQKPYVRVI